MWERQCFPFMCSGFYACSPFTICICVWPHDVEQKICVVSKHRRNPIFKKAR